MEHSRPSFKVREVKKKTKKHFDGFSPTHPKTPPAPPKCGLCFFSHHCFIVLFQFLDIFFTLKVKKYVESGFGPKPLPPLWIKSIKMCFFLNFPYTIIQEFISHCLFTYTIFTFLVSFKIVCQLVHSYPIREYLQFIF